MRELELWLHLLSTPELSRKKIRNLLQIFGHPENFIGNYRSEFSDLAFLSGIQISHLSSFKEPDQWQKISKLIERYSIKYLSCLNVKYPPYLKSIYDPPILIFYRGELTDFSLLQTMAIVGTRKPSNYGKMMTKKICSRLAESGFTIVSGLAYGIDEIAHRTALESAQRTIAVMATGVDIIYPPGNQKLADRITRNGLILSEYLPGTKAEKWYFPARNRIISGLSKGCVIIEGSKKSGAMLTAKFSLDQNRDVFALPGDINREQSEGPNFLIKIGAKPVTDVSDILEEYDIFLNDDKVNIPQLSTEEERIFQIIITNRPEINFDKIILTSEMNVNSLSSILLSLEMKSLIKRVSGNNYIVV